MLNFSKTLHIAVGLQHRDITSQYTGSGLKVEVGCCLCADTKQFHGSHEFPLLAAHPLGPRERERKVMAQQLLTQREKKKPKKPTSRCRREKGPCLRAKPSMKLIFPYSKKKKKKESL